MDIDKIIEDKKIELLACEELVNDINELRNRIKNNIEGYKDEKRYDWLDDDERKKYLRVELLKLDILEIILNDFVAHMDDNIPRK